MTETLPRPEPRKRLRRSLKVPPALLASALAALLLAAALIGEIAEAVPGTQGAEPGLQLPAVPKEAGTAPAPVAPVADWAQTALDRPLFAPDRRRDQAGPAALAELPRLAGTIRAADKLLAIFQPAGGGKPLVLERDATLAGWTVAEIGDGAVTLLRGASTTVLRLSYANLPTPAPSSGAPPRIVALHVRQTDPSHQP